MISFSFVGRFGLFALIASYPAFIPAASPFTMHLVIMFCILWNRLALIYALCIFLYK